MGSPYKKERKLITDFYMWMLEHEYDHNIRIRVENKAEIFLREREQKDINEPQALLMLGVSLSVCQHNKDYSKCNIIHMFKCKYCRLNPDRQTGS